MKTKSLVWLAMLLFGMAVGAQTVVSPQYKLVERDIAVDGKISDWKGIIPNVVHGSNHLWTAQQGLEAEHWQGDQDLSYRWRGAWSQGKLYFLFEVTDDKVVEGGAPLSYKCDCIEIYLDMKRQGGARVKIMDGRVNWLEKYDPKEMMGHEIHFVPGNPVRINLNHAYLYGLDKPQTDEFKKEWAGEVAYRKTEHGYLMEIGLAVPGVKLESGKVIGVEMGVCDDDGNQRESIMMWTGTKLNFWETMNEYGAVTLEGSNKGDAK